MSLMLPCSHTRFILMHSLFLIDELIPQSLCTNLCSCSVEDIVSCFTKEKRKNMQMVFTSSQYHIYLDSTIWTYLFCPPPLVNVDELPVLPSETPNPLTHSKIPLQSFSNILPLSIFLQYHSSYVITL